MRFKQSKKSSCKTEVWFWWPWKKKMGFGIRLVSVHNWLHLQGRNELEVNHQYCPFPRDDKETGPDHKEAWKIQFKKKHMRCNNFKCICILKYNLHIFKAKKSYSPININRQIKSQSERFNTSLVNNELKEYKTKISQIWTCLSKLTGRHL